MKKKTLLLGLTAAVLAMPVSALADPSISKTGSVDNASWIDGTNLLQIDDDDEDGIFIADLTGKKLSDQAYSSFSYSKGYIIADRYVDDDDEDTADVNREVLLDTEGNQLIDQAYGQISALNSKWVLGFTLKDADANQYDYSGLLDDRYFLIDTIDVYYIKDGSVSKVTTLTRDQYHDAAASGDYIKIQNRADDKINMYDSSFNLVEEDLYSTYDDGDTDTGDYITYEENGQEGVKDADGNILVKPAYKTVSNVQNGYVEVSTGDYVGLLDLEGNVIVPAEYDDIILNTKCPASAEDTTYTGSYVADGYVAVEKDGKLGYVDLEGNVTLEPKYAYDNVTVNGASATMTDLEGNIHILSADGQDTVLDDDHDDITVLSYSNGLLYSFRNDDYDYGLIDWHGNELLSAENKDLGLSGDGTILLVEPDYDEADLYDVTY